MSSDRTGLPASNSVWEGDWLRSRRFDDVYCSRDGGPAEKRYVFLTGCNLPAAWQGATTFCIGELGFGAGLNFLVTWEAWRRHRPAGAHLHYIAVEGFPLTVTEMRAACGAWSELQPVADELARA